MEERLFGQDHIIEPMSQMIQSWYKRNSLKGMKKFVDINSNFAGSKQSKGDLFSFHIAGDNGVGKTYAISLLKESLFQYSNSENFLYLSGTNFEGNDPDKVCSFLCHIFLTLKQRSRDTKKSFLIRLSLNSRNVRNL